MPPVTYRIAANDRISLVDTAWCEEAARGGIPLGAVFGRVLWDCFADVTTTALYQALVRRVRAGDAARVEFRCDLPDRRRWFELRIAALGGGAVEFASTLRREESRPAVALLESGRAGSGGVVRMCSWCQRIALPEGRWSEVEEAAGVLGFWREEAQPQITHGICDACAAQFHFPRE